MRAPIALSLLLILGPACEALLEGGEREAGGEAPARADVRREPDAARADAGLDARRDRGAAATPDALVCAPGRASCDGSSANGCEVLLASDPKHCGQCGRACRGAVCGGGRCQVKVLIYAGSDAGSNGVKNTKAILDAASAAGQVPGVQFTTSTSTVVTSAKLAGVHVLVMPGGSSGWSYLHNAAIDGAAIQQFVKAGGGYVGTCAGAYAGAAKTTGHAQYAGWGVAPGATSVAFSYEGTLSVRATALATKLLGATGAMTLHHWNGPAMLATGSAEALAHYDSTIHKGKVALLLDRLGAGRSVLAGPHPELDPQRPELVSRLVGWASGSFNP